MLNLVKSYDEVIENSLVFHESVIEAEEIIKKLSFFRHWYYIEEMDKFVPSKFIGYKNNTLAHYNFGTSQENGYMDGRETVPHLKKWFRLIPDDKCKKYYKELQTFLEKYEKKPNKMVQLYFKK
ncbi:MAG: hypothetical protein FH751_12715 [Firmicutes bacterium]|nr:hypothetical protein [Bacillota bacterium]